MQFTNLDTISRRRLLEKGLPLHFYIKTLTLAASALRELSQLKLQVINTVRLPLNDYYAVDLPSDCSANSVLGVFIPSGQRLAPVSKDDSLSPLRTKDATGTFTTYGDDEDSLYGYSGTWFWNTSDWGEYTGGEFGGSGRRSNGWKLVRERRQIQLTETFTHEAVVLKYVSNGLSANAASEIDPEAWSAIQSYVDWKDSPNADFKDSGEARTFYNELRLLGSKLNPLTTDDILDIVRGSAKASPKS
jgi:hypothetical protein